MDKNITVWEYIRIKFKQRTKASRPTRVYKITHKNGTIEYAPAGVKGTSRRLKVEDLILTWEGGQTPLPRPLRKYDDATLMKRGYSIEEIRTIRERPFSSKDIDLVAKNLKIKRPKAKELLIEHKGNRHKIYEKKNTRGQNIPNSGWDNDAGIEKPTRKQRQNTKNQLRKELQAASNRSKSKKRKFRGRF